MGAYQIPFSSAATECNAKGMVLATKDQLQIAYNKGFEMCACGWVTDGDSYYPMQTTKPGCGSVGINHCARKDLADVYCYKKPTMGNFYSKNTFTKKTKKCYFRYKFIQINEKYFSYNLLLITGCTTDKDCEGSRFCDDGICKRNVEIKLVGFDM